MRPVGLAIKRILDVLLSAALMVVLAPILLAVAVLIKHDSRGPVFFRQERVGLRGRLFRICKFRTMVVGAAEIGTGLVSTADDPRTTRFSRFLRSIGSTSCRSSSMFCGEK